MQELCNNCGEIKERGYFSLVDLRPWRNSDIEQNLLIDKLVETLVLLEKRFTGTIDNMQPLEACDDAQCHELQF